MSDTRRPLFDLIRHLIGRPFRQSEVDALDDLLDSANPGRGALAQDTVTPVTPSRTAREIGPAGIALVKAYEGCAKRRGDGTLEAYPDPGTGGEPWTIGWGATGRDHVHGGRIGRGTVWTQGQCDARLESDLARYAADVADAIGNASTRQTQFDALVSFHYNTGAIRSATLTKLHRAGDHEAAAREFARWRFAGGREMRGLARRRAAEAALYRS
ncbi:lysozyme [Aurantiacibacter spongiae]|uniref:Lysozyme n=1 Tax=Aurantiacibacter spongiae TaxID=2488860 RepID=A0A3N5CSC3_9SPHN|nr:lysozyme [Aurantiacibacter spongiae]RPF72034.1 lysozyme [Aurantiacibacter spongiae]